MVAPMGFPPGQVVHRSHLVWRLLESKCFGYERECGSTPGKDAKSGCQWKCRGSGIPLEPDLEAIERDRPLRGCLPYHGRRNHPGQGQLNAYPEENVDHLGTSLSAAPGRHRRKGDNFRLVVTAGTMSTEGLESRTIQTISVSRVPESREEVPARR